MLAVGLDETDRLAVPDGVSELVVLGLGVDVPEVLAHGVGEGLMDRHTVELRVWDKVGEAPVDGETDEQGEVDRVGEKVWVMVREDESVELGLEERPPDKVPDAVVVRIWLALCDWLSMALVVIEVDAVELREWEDEGERVVDTVGVLV